MNDLARTFIVLGVVLVLVGIVMLVLPRMPFGKLPGDIVVKKDNFTFYFPLATSIIVSIIISLVLYLLGKFR